MTQRADDVSCVLRHDGIDTSQSTATILSRLLHTPRVGVVAYLVRQIQRSLYISLLLPGRSGKTPNWLGLDPWNFHPKTPHPRVGRAHLPRSSPTPLLTGGGKIGLMPEIVNYFLPFFWCQSPTLRPGISFSFSAINMFYLCDVPGWLACDVSLMNIV